ncbi:MAG: hypothetical protein IPH20_05785 [Bacteroidales bacterium]|nr:hypothetical protein [Bacteroidales bacterium]
MKRHCGLQIKSLLGIFLICILFISVSCKKDGINKQNSLPLANYVVSPLRGDVNTVFDFDAGTVSDFEDPVSILEVRWDWNKDKLYDTEFSTLKTTTHQYNTVGVYFPMIEVRDTKGMTDTIKQMVVVVNDLSNQPPDIPYYITPPEWQDWMDETVIFKWTCNDPENDPLTYDIWTGKSRTSLSLVQSGITYFNLVDGVPQYETTLSGFEYNTDYYWQIGVKDIAGNYTVGLISKFTTRPEGAK